MLRTYLAVMFGGAIGSGLRLWLSNLSIERWGQAFPIGTLIVNVTGSFIIAFFAGLAGPGALWESSPIARQFVMTGVLGGFTTFSSFSFQTLALADQGNWGGAAANVLLSVVLCLGAAWLGHVTAGAITSRAG
jgi:CrcB protein